MDINNEKENINSLDEKGRMRHQYIMGATGVGYNTKYIHYKISDKINVELKISRGQEDFTLFKENEKLTLSKSEFIAIIKKLIEDDELSF